MNPWRWTFKSQFLGERGFKIWILMEGSVIGKVWRVAVVEEGVKWNLIPSVYGKGGDFGGRRGCARDHGDFGFTTPLIGRERCDKLGSLRASIEADGDNQLRQTGSLNFPPGQWCISKERLKLNFFTSEEIGGLWESFELSVIWTCVVPDDQ